MDFHISESAVLDAVDEGLIERDPTRRQLSGKSPCVKKIKYINQFELHTLLTRLVLKAEVSWIGLLFLLQKPGCVFRRHGNNAKGFRLRPSNPLHQQDLGLQGRGRIPTDKEQIVGKENSD
jgi:hypothetical protein